jgi:Universal stress protein family.
MYRKILVAYNGAPESRLALDEAVRIAPDASVEVHLAAVVHYPSAYLLAGEYVPRSRSRTSASTWKRISRRRTGCWPPRG